MKIKSFIVITFFLLTACQTSIPAPISTTTNVEFTLSPGQIATVTDAGLSITFISVSTDQRCPSGIECAISGPVTVSLSISNKSGVSSEEILQTFTGSDGLSPDMAFEGIKDRVSLDGYQIKITNVLPYPKNKFGSIKSSEYKIGLKVTKN